MAIPESQLNAWSGLGAQKGSQDTYASITAALAAHTWPQGMNHIVYLQGSYPNSTNVRGDSDVDIVVESTNVFYHDVPENLRKSLGLTGGGAYGHKEFKAQVRAALSSYYRSGSVTDSGSGKCLKVAGSSNRLDADVVPCITFKHYRLTSHSSSGIALWTNAGVRVVNYPKIHIKNGAAKNAACGTTYKPIVRIFKNARSVAGNSFPSYFLECLLYNIPNSNFATDYGTTFRNILVYLVAAKDSGSLAKFVCQNEQQLMFGDDEHQVDLYFGNRVIDDLVDLWNNWR